MKITHKLHLPRQTKTTAAVKPLAREKAAEGKLPAEIVRGIFVSERGPSFMRVSDKISYGER